MSPAVGTLVLNTNDQWMLLTPQRCPNGHPLGPGQVLVGHAPCSCDQRGGHTTWTCSCGATIYAPAIDNTCKMLNGAGFLGDA